MNKLFLIISISLFTLSIKAQQLWQINKDTIITWYYHDGDEFGKDDLKEKWDSWFGWARSIVSNKEQQYYTDYKNTTVKDGCLNITVDKTPIKARLVDWLPDNDTVKTNGKPNGLNLRDFNYQSGMLKSKYEFLRGYFEIKFKSLSEQGIWPAFWLYGGTPNEEIDIMELQTNKPNEIHVDSHCPDRCDYNFKNFFGQKISFGGWIKLTEPLKDGFNVVSGMWNENEVRYYLNGVCIGVSKATFNKPKALAVNVAVPSKNGPFGPGPDETTPSFSPFVVDYIRVWSKDEDKKGNVLLSSNEPNYEVQNTTLKKINKFTFNKKKDTQHDGIFISSLKNDKGDVTLFCNGLRANEYYVLKTYNGKKLLSEQNISSREFTIKRNDIPRIKLEISYMGKQVTYQ